MGGQIMPPVMGAVAFIMAETIGVLADAGVVPDHELCIRGRCRPLHAWLCLPRDGRPVRLTPYGGRNSPVPPAPDVRP